MTATTPRDEAEAQPTPALRRVISRVGAPTQAATTAPILEPIDARTAALVAAFLGRDVPTP